MIQPTIGRVVWFHPGSNDSLFKPGYAEPRTALVVRVWNERMVNLVVFDTEGNPHSRTSVGLVQEGDLTPPNSSYCCWMPYQVGQAKRHEADKQLAK